LRACWDSVTSGDIVATTFIRGSNTVLKDREAQSH